MGQVSKCSVSSFFLQRAERLRKTIMQKWPMTWRWFALVTISHCLGCGETNKNISPAPDECAEGNDIFTYSSPLPPDSVAVAEFTLDASFAYFTERGTNNDGRILKRSLDGGDPVVLAKDEILPLHIAVDAANVYWTTETEIRKMPLYGGKPSTIASGFGSPQSIVVAGDYVYWTTSPAKLMRVTINGGDVVTLIDESATNLAFMGLAIDATHLYLASRGDIGGSNGSIKKMPIAGGSVVTLATGQNDPAQVTVGAADVYWTNTGDFHANVGLMKAPLMGGPIETVVSSQSNTFAQYAEIGGILLNADGLFYTVKGTQDSDHYDGTVMRMPLDGGESTILASALRYVGVSLAVQGCQVYFEATGNLHRVRFP